MVFCSVWFAFFLSLNLGGSRFYSHSNIPFHKIPSFDTVLDPQFLRFSSEIQVLDLPLLNFGSRRSLPQIQFLTV